MNLLPDCASLHALLRQVDLSEEAAAQALRSLPTDREIRDQYALLLSDADRFFSENDSAPDAAQRYLALYCAFLPLCRETYRARGIPEAVFIDTFRDIARWEREHFARTGEHGLSEQEWLGNHLQLRLFALGELQFEPLDSPGMALPAELEGLTTLNVHIPKGANLGERQASYDRALPFFGADRAAAVCSSWLLSPVLDELLPPQSRILAFQREFRIIQIDGTSRQAEERIFGRILEDPGLYPEQTSLQRAAKARLLRGGQIPSARGCRSLP